MERAAVALILFARCLMERQDLGEVVEGDDLLSVGAPGQGRLGEGGLRRAPGLAPDPAASLCAGRDHIPETAVEHHEESRRHFRNEDCGFSCDPPPPPPYKRVGYTLFYILIFCTQV
ncbi:hypothetical protein GE061_018883 [Apolygus lucorum]|uniref:Uncharacterized protein n=1 Tax=Apolygus lucorum TaxID=248454 RepID=A0A6A4JKD5_APOLU|nr:hypothetical protein GE061_018883 [Apolygus lucorum]